MGQHLRGLTRGQTCPLHLVGQSPCPSAQGARDERQEKPVFLYTYSSRCTGKGVGPCGDKKPFRVPHFLFVGERLQPPRPSLTSKGQIQAVTNQGGEGTRKPRESSQETINWETGMDIYTLLYIK